MSSQNNPEFREADQIIMVGVDGKTSAGMKTVGMIAKSVPALLPILPVTTMLRLLHLDEITYRFIAHRRYAISKLIKFLNGQGKKGTGS